MYYEMKSIQANQMINNWTYIVFGSIILILEDISLSSDFSPMEHSLILFFFCFYHSLLCSAMFF